MTDKRERPPIFSTGTMTGHYVPATKAFTVGERFYFPVVGEPYLPPGSAEWSPKMREGRVTAIDYETGVIEIEWPEMPKELTMTPIERAARALCIAQSGVDDFDALDEGMQQTLKENAAAVLRANYEPTPGMIEAGRWFEVTPHLDSSQTPAADDAVAGVWQAMIDAAIAELDG